jgi:hypothetical protein
MTPYRNAYSYGIQVAEGYLEPLKREQFETQDEWEGYCNGIRDVRREDQINDEDFAEMGIF